MGLRINTNISGIRALRNLHVNDRNQQKSLERLSTGLRINRASDDPSGLVISERLRAQISSQKQAVENTQNDSNMIAVADEAMGQISNLLADIKDSVVFALNTGGNTPEQIAAEQDAVDQAISAVDRIANTTRYSDRNLLTGSAGYLVSTPDDDINDVHIRSLYFSPGQTQRTLTFDIVTSPERANANQNAAYVNSTGVSNIRITGNRGSADVSVASSTTIATSVSLINSVANNTGVYAQNVAGVLTLYSEEFGSDQTARLDVISTTGTFDTLGAGGSITDTVNGAGVDAGVSYGGTVFTGVGSHVTVQDSTSLLEFNIDEDNIPAPPAAAAAAAMGVQSITVDRSGLIFQLGEKASSTDQLFIGIDSVGADLLGTEDVVDSFNNAISGLATLRKGGFLSTVSTGGTNDLTANPQNALRIIDQAIDDVTSQRAYLGSIQANTLESNVDTLGVSIENLSASLSDIRDLDFAEETTQFTKTQILYQAGTAVLASANLIPQTVLTLLQ